jgi:hypothetical protein
MPELIDNERPSGGEPGSDPRPAGGGDLGGGGSADEASIADRLGRDPGNLGGGVADEGDITHPAPEPGPAQM